MKAPTYSITKVIALFGCMLFFACALFAQSGVSTKLIPLKKPIPLDRVPAPRAEEITQGAPNSTPNLTAYQQGIVPSRSLSNHPVQIVGDPRIVIENDCVVGWQVDFKDGDPIGLNLRYSRFENPFILAEGLTEKSVLDATWNKLKKIFSEFTTSHPLMLNVRTKDDKKVVCGMWYVLSGSSRSKYDRKTNRFNTSFSNAEQRRALDNVYALTVIPVPENVYAKPHLVYSSTHVEEATVPFQTGPARERLAVDSESTVAMPPYKVQGEWVQLRAVVETNKKSPAFGKMMYLEVVNVTPGTPFDRGGIRPGDMITEYQGVKTLGMDPLEFDSKVSALPFGSKLTLDFKDPAGQRRRLHVVVNAVIATVSK
jgi:hypothetical protein